ncbi:MAG: LytR/AlgR family response regulator transcription factor [Bacteroidales bacterium]
MKVLITEDEQDVAKRLIRLIGEVAPDFGIQGVTDSVEDTVIWLRTNPAPDLLFMDIHLADGISFDVFKQIEIQSPVIFTTAYDNYAIQAFKVNSIDYLLKPINKLELEKAIRKFRASTQKDSQSIDYRQLADMIRGKEQKRIVVRYGQKLKAIELQDAACFYTENKSVYLHTFSDERYPIDERLDALEEILDPYLFFRVNRSAIVNFKAIHEMHAYSKSRVNIELKKPLELSFTSSTERSADFKEWLAGKI